MRDIKTLIELFDSEQINNVIAGMCFEPEKIVFIGFKEFMTEKRKKCILNFFRKSDFNPEIEFEIVGRYDYDKILEKFSVIISENHDCGIDLTGGKELLLAASGEISATANIPVFRFDIKSGKFLKIKNCSNVEVKKTAALSMSDFIELYGGAIIKKNPEEEWTLDDDFKKDIEVLWNICVADIGLWNRQLSVIGSVEKYGSIDDNLTVRADANVISSKSKVFFLDKSIMKQLEANKLISGFSANGGIITYRYKNDNIRRILTKSGNVLELYIYTLANEIENENPGFYDDIDIGVMTDWDGVIHDSYSGVADTRNEIDVMLMCDCTPVFISCKNGHVHKEALYELQTVAEKFGGDATKKFLFATEVNSGEGGAFLKQRANDMKIGIVDGIMHMSRDELKKIIKERIK